MTLNVQDVPLGDVIVPKGRRKLREENVLELMDSILMVGLQQPITVRNVEGHLELVAGGHRHEACKRLEWETIPAGVFSGSALEAQIYEIDENLRRAELNALERDEQIAKRVRLTEKRIEIKEAEEKKAREDAAKKRKADAQRKKRNGEESPVGGDSDSVSQKPSTDDAPKPKPGRPESGEAQAARETGTSRGKIRKAKRVDELGEDVKILARELGLADNETALLKAADEGWDDAMAAGCDAEKLGEAIDAYHDTGVDTAQEKMLRVLWAAQEASLRAQAKEREERKAKPKPKPKKQDREEQDQAEYCVRQWIDLRLEIERLPEDIVRSALAQIQEDIEEVIAAYDETREESPE